MLFLLACRASSEKSAYNIMGVTLHVICPFLLVTFSILSLSSVFCGLITVCLLVYPAWDSQCFLDMVEYFLSPLGKFPSIISSNIFSGPFSLSSPSGTLIMRMLMCLMLSQRSLRLSSLFSFFFSIFCFAAIISTILSSRPLTHFSASVILLLIPSSVLFIFVCLFFSSSRSLVNISCIFSIFDSIVFPEIPDHLHCHYSEFFF